MRAKDPKLSPLLPTSSRSLNERQPISASKASRNVDKVTTTRSNDSSVPRTPFVRKMVSLSPFYSILCFAVGHSASA